MSADFHMICSRLCPTGFFPLLQAYPVSLAVLFKVFLVHFKEITGCDGVVICEFDIIPHSLLEFGDGVFHQVRVDGMESFSFSLAGNFFFICLGFGLHIGIQAFENVIAIVVSKDIADFVISKIKGYLFVGLILISSGNGDGLSLLHI